MRYSLIFIITLLFIYVLLRAYYVPFTHDECMSLKIVTGEDTGIGRAANNHRLNTLIMTIVHYLIGDKEIYLRLSAILGMCLYSVFTYKIFHKSANIALALVGVSLLLFNPYQLEFFGLARGYGLALGLGLMSIYYLLKTERCTSFRQFNRYMFLAFSASLVATYSNYLSINLNACLMLCFFLEFIRLRNSKSIPFSLKDKITIGAIYLINLIILYILLKQILVLRQEDQLSFGGQNGFIDDVLTFLIHRSIYTNYYGETFWITLRQSIIIIFGGTLIYQLVSAKYNALSRVVLLIFLMIFASIVQYYLIGTKYPPVRSSQLYITLFGLLLYYLFTEIHSFLSRKSLKVVFGTLLILVIMIPLGWHLGTSLNLKNSKEWSFDAHTRDVMKKIAEQQKANKSGMRKLSISNNWWLEPAINYYRKMNSMDFLVPANRDGILLNTDYVYCTTQDKINLNLGNYYSTVVEYPDIKTVLLKKSSGN
jgi:hypothetical protein